MTLEQASLAIQVVAAVSVVGSLIFVGLQLRQSDRTLRANSLQSVLDGYRDRTFLPGITNGEVLDIYARGLNSMDLLDENEKRRFWFILVNEFLHMQHVWKLRELNMIEAVDYNAWLAFTASLVKTPGGSALWPIAKTIVTPTLSRVIDEYLERHPNQPSFIELNPLFKSAKVVG
jgi:hypothetical protein